MFGRVCCCLLVVALLSLPCPLAGQGMRSQRRAPEYGIEPPSHATELPVFPPSWPPPSWAPTAPPGQYGFSQLARAAGLIFSGTVTRIERRPATLGQSVETVAVSFRVENAIRGATPGVDLTIMQWVGLWSAGQRYRVGERVLLFLYPNSKLGLTSCVGGGLGRFDVDRAGRVLLTAQHLTAFRRDPVLGGRSRARFSDFAQAVRHAGEEE